MSDLQILVIEANSVCGANHGHDLSEFEEDPATPTIWRAFCYECNAKVQIDLEAPTGHQIVGVAALQDCEDVANQSDDEDDDGQPDEYTEWQGVFGGDDWDHGQFDTDGDEW